MKKQIKDIQLKMDLYPRLKINDNKVQEYKEVLTLLPKIIINQDNILIDGAHRLYAHKEAEQKEIEVEIINTKDDDDILLKAIELNSKHGFQLTQGQKRKQVQQFYYKILNEEAESFDVERLKQAFSIPDSTFSDWTKDLNDELEAQRLEKILKLHLQCKTQEEIADLVGLKQKSVGIKIKQIEHFLDVLYSNSISDNGIIYDEIIKKWYVLVKLEIPKDKSKLTKKFVWLSKKWLDLLVFKPQLFNIWNQSKMTNETSHFGNVPIEFTENLLYYYTEPFDIIYDPFAGGGSTIDACEKWFRKYYCADRIPKETRQEIKKQDINDGIPKDLPNNIKLVYLDPPYWKQSENQYSKDKEDLANMSLESFYKSLQCFAKDIKKKLSKDGKVALIIQATQWKNNNVRIDHAFDICEIFRKLGYEIEQRIICPYSTEQYNAQMVIKAKEEKICLQTYRDLIVFKLK